MLEGEICRIWKLGAVQDDLKVNCKRKVLLRKIRSNVERSRFLGKDEYWGRLKLWRIKASDPSLWLELKRQKIKS